MKPTARPSAPSLLASACVAWAAWAGAGCASPSPSTEPLPVDSESVLVAGMLVEAMGGREAWDSTRLLRWRFFGRRLHHWDKLTGDVRIDLADEEGRALVLVLNLGTRDGRAWRDGAEVTDEEELAALLESAFAMWTNDSYWMFMPYKLDDPGVVMRYEGVGETTAGNEADALQITFHEVGLTPKNEYVVLFGRESHLVEEWYYRSDRDDPDEELRSLGPWEGWERFGRILLATSHGRGFDWEIAVHDEVPEGLFSDPLFDPTVTASP